MNRKLASGAVMTIVAIGGGLLLSPRIGATPTDRGPETVYGQTCGYCHGRNVGPMIRGRKLPAATVKYFVRNGANAMPAFRQTEISDSELDALAIWISSSPVDPKEAGE